MSENLVEFARRLKEQIPIEQLVGDYVPTLARRGRTFKANCPFHDEKTPSFHVNPEYGFYHCFGCQAHGDVIRFVQDYEKVDFRVAVEMLARRFGVPMPEFGGGGGRGNREERDRKRTRLISLSAAAERFFMVQLWDERIGARAREYLFGRGLTEAQIRKYRLGFAPDGWEALLREARLAKFSEDEVAEAGLAIRKDNGGMIDRFRNRVMFPIRDQHGDVVAFGGRLLEGEGAKYLNSSDSPIFHKGRLLYGLHDAREAIRESGEAVLLEGYMDWIALHSHGVGNVLAGLGTAFGEEQARLVRRFTERVVLHYDGDPAGRKAMFRAAELLLARGLQVRVAALPAGHDPDTYVRAEGEEAVRDLFRHAPDAMDFFMDEAVEKFPPHTPRGKADMIDWIAPMLRAMEDPVLRGSHLRVVANRAGVEPADVERALAPGARRYYADEQDEASRSGRPGDPLPWPVDEMVLLDCLVRMSRHAPAFRAVTEDLFEHELTRTLFIRIHDHAREQPDGDNPLDPFSLCSTPGERDLMGHILLLDQKFAGGEIDAGKIGSSPDKTMAVIEDIAVLLRRKRSRRMRGRFRAEAGGAGRPGGADNPGILSSIHALARETALETERRFGEENPPG